jgi:hypothetical protein
MHVNIMGWPMRDLILVKQHAQFAGLRQIWAQSHGAGVRLDLVQDGVTRLTGLIFRAILPTAAI